MTGNANRLLLAIALIALGLAVNPVATWLAGRSDGASISGIDIPLMVKAALPFLASLGALAITRQPRLATIAALVPLLASVVVHTLLLTGTNSLPLAALVLAPFCWINFLVCFPLGVWIALRCLDDREVERKPASTSPGRTGEG
jgi:hypothetical protein